MKIQCLENVILEGLVTEAGPAYSEDAVVESVGDLWKASLPKRQCGMREETRERMLLVFVVHFCNGLKWC